MASKRNTIYDCPYCNKRFTRDNLVIHIDKSHEEMIPKDYSPFRVVFDYINKKSAGYNGKCIICGEESGWNEDKGKYNRICDKLECKRKYIERFEQNMLRTKGTTRISSTAEGQAKMLANRRISGKYKFSDGIERTYTGTYEKKALEFMDKVLGCRGEDVITPGPIMEYMYQGKKHIYIPDIYYEPYNLIIEVKDGGDNPNNRPMDEYRAKQIAKEEYLIKNTDFNYLRLTNNDFSQLLSVFAELKMQMVDNNTDRVIRINEEYIEESVNTTGCKTPEELHEWMIKNIKYANYTKLMSHDEVLEKKKGSCHDQVMFEYTELKKMGISARGLFMIENNDNGQGGETHSLVYYHKDGKLYWFENAWRDMAGITEPDEPSVSGLKKLLKEYHDNGDWGNLKKFPKVEFASFSIPSHKPGENLQQFVDRCFGEPVKENVMMETVLSSGQIKAILAKIRAKVKSDSKPPTGNQNCLLCTWSLEAQLRGYNILPRPVYSPRDIIFKQKGYDIIKYPSKMHIKDKQNVIDIITNAGDGARFYTHVNWKGSTGGHEFVTLNSNNKVYVADAQAGILADINSSQGSYYFRNINYDNSYLIRMDNKEFNEPILKYNDDKYILDWDEEADIAYMQSDEYKNLSEFVDMVSKLDSSTKIQEAMNALTTGYIPGFRDTGSVYVVNYMQNNVFSGFGIADNIKLTNLIIRNDKGLLEKVNGEEFLGENIAVYSTTKSIEEISDLFAPYIGKEVSENFIYESITGKTLYTYDQIKFDSNLKKIYTYTEALDHIAMHTRSLFMDTPDPIQINEDCCKYVYIDEDTGLFGVADRALNISDLDTTKTNKFISNLKIKMV